MPCFGFEPPRRPWPKAAQCRRARLACRCVPYCTWIPKRKVSSWLWTKEFGSDGPLFSRTHSMANYSWNRRLGLIVTFIRMERLYSWPWVEAQVAQTIEVWNAGAGWLALGGAQYSAQEQQQREKAYDEALRSGRAGTQAISTKQDGTAANPGANHGCIRTILCDGAGPGEGSN